ncbi:pPIWI_RE module domain-containing protein [Streptomyces sp. NPDC058357]|uniref:pPIWI_RE module domain-containing protein n=1 Tax=unclassified Streptomyces TaxID=2593676 RepID=UPI00364A0208
MPVNYRNIRTASWRPDHQDVSVIGRYRALPFPEQWRDSILELCNAGRPQDADPWRTAPTRALEQAIQAYAPDVLVMPRPFGARAEGDPARWLYADAELADPLPPDVLSTLIAHWLRDIRPEPEHRGLLRQVRADLAAHTPRWEPAERELVACHPTEGGTASPTGHQYTLTPDWLARRVLSLSPYPFDGGSLRFRAMPRGPRDKGAELVSQPLPYDPDGSKGTWWFSIVLNVTLHTVPFDPLPRYHLHWSVRRWATRVSKAGGRLHLPYGSRTSVLLRPRVPVLPGVPLSERFAVAQLERFRDRETGAFADRWAHGGPARLLGGVVLGEQLPDVDDLLTAPEKWLTDGARAGIVYRTAMGRHEVGAGLMPNQISQLSEWAEQAMPEELSAALPHTRAALTANRPLNAPPTTVKPEEKAAEEEYRTSGRRRAAALAVSTYNGPHVDNRPVLELQLVWQTAEMRETAITALTELLGLPKNTPESNEMAHRDSRADKPVTMKWVTPELAVRLNCFRPIHYRTDNTAIALTGDLELPEGVRRTEGVVSAALHSRRAETAAWLHGLRGRPPGTNMPPALALVEIDRADDFTSTDHDPKFALRLGFADAAFVTQFLAVPKKVKGYNTVGNQHHRARMAWDDGLRQLGARVYPEGGIASGLPDGLRHAAVWMVRRNRSSRNRWATDVPVAVLVTPEGGGLARIEGWDPDADDGAGAWVPYPAMLIRLTRLAEVHPVVPGPRGEGDAPKRRSWRADRAEQRRRAEEWLQQIRASLRRAPTLLLAEAQNARSHWTWLQDSHAEPDRIRDGEADPRRLDLDLRLIRVRTGRGRETPQWWGDHPGGGANGIAAGLWCPANHSTDNRVFHSANPKPVQFKSSAVEADKLAPRPIRMGKRKGELTIDTGVTGWTPDLLEIAVLGCHPEAGDAPESLASAVHLLRQPPDYPEALSLPLPLHLAGLGQDYVLPHRTADAPRPEAHQGADPVADPDPTHGAAPGLEESHEDETAAQLTLFGN